MRYVLTYLEYLNMVKYIWPHLTHFESCQSRRIRHLSYVKIECHRQENTLFLNNLRFTNVTDKITIDRFTYNLKHFCCWVRKSDELWWLTLLKVFRSNRRFLNRFSLKIWWNYEKINKKWLQILGIQRAFIFCLHLSFS